MVTEDLRYLWAAYRAGAIKGLPPGIETKEFWPIFTQGIELIRPGAGVTTLLARTDRGVIPVGWLIGWRYALSSGRAIEVEAMWAPWATPRNKLEAVVAFLYRTRTAALVLWSCRKAEARLFEHACRYGVARTVGTVKDLFGVGEDALVFQSVEIR
ncbi:MAG TPA: hypothetical protein VF957_23520 [Bradyrhizobium sp.]